MLDKGFEVKERMNLKEEQKMPTKVNPINLSNTWKPTEHNSVGTEDRKIKI